MVGLVQRAAVMAGAGGLATAFVHPRQGGRQHRASRGELLQATVQHPADLRRVARDTHRRAPGISGKPLFYRERPEKPEVRRKKIPARRDEPPQQSFYPGLALPSRCDKFRIPQSWIVYSSVPTGRYSGM